MTPSSSTGSRSATARGSRSAGDGDRYADFRERDGSFRGPGYTEAEAASLPAQYRVPGVVIKPVAAAVR